MKHLPLMGDGLDRMASRRRDPVWLEEAWHSGRVLALCDGRALVVDRADQDTAELVFLAPDDVPQDAERYFLGVETVESVESVETVDGAEAAEGSGRVDVAYFAVVTPLPAVEGCRAATLQDVGHTLSDRDASVFATGLALANWHDRHQFSPKTGERTRTAEGGWTRLGGEEGAPLWPRTDPAAIVLVHDGVPGDEGRCLLATNTAWQQTGALRRYACLAGFVEPGESAEHAAAREILEEVGLPVRDIRYVGSQPWPFPGSLMLGFMAMADPTAELHLDPEEIAEARWFRRSEVSAALAGEAVGFTLPMRVSIARYLICQWVAGAV